MRKSLFKTFVVLAVSFAAVQTGFAQTARWVETASWSGEGIVNTAPFYISGSKWRVKYVPRRVRGSTGRASFDVFVRDAQGRVVQEAAGSPDLLRGWRTYKNDQGVRYLTILGVNAEWEVKVEQYVTIIEEWQFLQNTRDLNQKESKFGEWAGYDADAEYAIKVDDAPWVVDFRNEAAGELEVRVLDDKMNVKLSATQDGRGRQSAWIYAPGEYKLQIKAHEARWRVILHGALTPKEALEGKK